MEEIYISRCGDRHGYGFDCGYVIIVRSADPADPDLRIGYIDYNPHMEVISHYTRKALIVPSTIEDKKQAAKDFVSAEMARALSFNTRTQE